MTAEATCGQKHAARCPRSDQKLARALKIMAVVEGELGRRGSAAKSGEKHEVVAKEEVWS